MLVGAQLRRARRALWILEARDAPAARGPARARRGARARWASGAGGCSGTASPARTGWTCSRAPSDAPAGRAAIARALAAAVVGVGRARPGGSPLRLADGAALRGLARAGRAPHVERGFVCPGFARAGDLRGAPRQDPAPRDLRTARPLARAAARLPDRGRDDARARRPRAMEDFLRLHRLRWAVEGGSSGIPPGVGGGLPPGGGAAPRGARLAAAVPAVRRAATRSRRCTASRWAGASSTTSPATIPAWSARSPGRRARRPHHRGRLRARAHRLRLPARHGGVQARLGLGPP